jgi:hypothetical protein
MIRSQGYGKARNFIEGTGYFPGCACRRNEDACLNTHNDVN